MSDAGLCGDRRRYALGRGAVQQLKKSDDWRFLSGADAYPTHVIKPIFLAMQVDGKRTLVFSEQTLVRTEPGMRQAVRDAARREGLTMAELIRRALQAAISTTSAHEART